MCGQVFKVWNSKQRRVEALSVMDRQTIFTSGNQEAVSISSWFSAVKKIPYAPAVPFQACNGNERVTAAWMLFSALRAHSGRGSTPKLGSYGSTVGVSNRKVLQYIM